MQQIGIDIFIIVWGIYLGINYYLAGRTVGVTVFFAASTALYVMLPGFFHAENYDWLPRLVFGSLTASLGFSFGYGLGSLRMDQRDSAISKSNSNKILPRDITIPSCVLLGAFSLFLLFFLMPNFINEVSSYDGRIAFQGESGKLTFLLNQAVIALSIILIYLLQRGRYFFGIIIFTFLVWWAFFSNAKLSMLTGLAAVFAVIVSYTWSGKIRKAYSFWVVALMPMLLPVMVFYSIYRGIGGDDSSYLFTLFSTYLSDLGEYDIDVGDFDGPHKVLMFYYKQIDTLELKLGETYFTQTKVLIPREYRGKFADLTDEFAEDLLGAAYRPGVGFAYSPWAEAIINWGYLGFFIQGLLVGVISRGIWIICMKVLNSVEVALFFQFSLIVLFQRGYIMAHIKMFVVLSLGIILVWKLVSFLRREVLKGAIDRRTDNTALPESP